MGCGHPGDRIDGVDVASTGTNERAASSGYEIRLFHWAWPNPRPDAEVESLDLISAQDSAAPFLVAITAE